MIKLRFFSLLLLSLILPLTGQEHSDDSFFPEEEESLSLSGYLKYDTNISLNRKTVTAENLTQTPLSADISGLLGFSWNSERAEAYISFRFQNSVNDIFDSIDEAWIRYYSNRFDIELGILKPIWGNGDGVHVVDVLTGIDYSEFIVPDYRERKIANEMIKVNIQPSEDILLELAWLPLFHPDILPLESEWAVSGIPESVADYFHVPENLHQSQFALRYSHTLSNLDLSLIYYNGFMRQPGIIAELENVATLSYNLHFYYDPLQVFGLTLSTEMNNLYIRGEGALYLSEDSEGNDPLMKNSSLKYLAAVDIPLPLNNLLIILQGVGNILLQSDSLSETDPEYSSEGTYTSQTLSLSITDNYLYSTLFIELSGAFSIENRDFMIKPHIKWKPADNLIIGLFYQIFEGYEPGNFSQYDDKDFISIYAEYLF